MSEQVNFTTPVGRLVLGSLYKGQTTDAENRPLVIKSGPNAGQPRVDYFFAVAIPKGAETHWASTEWGKLIWETGHKAFPNGQGNSPAFAWKVTDGDSIVPNRAGRRPCDREGYAHHWVLHFSSGYAPKIFTADGSAPIVEPDAVKLGYFVQVAGSVAGNESLQQPGVFLNHNMVALSGYGPEIVVGPDPKSVGFGQSPLPAGASAVPLGGMAPVVTGAPSVPGVPTPTPAPLPAQVTVVPNHTFVAGPGAALPPPPAPSVVAPVHVMLPAANGATYEQMRAAGWTDQQLVQHGMMSA